MNLDRKSALYFLDGLFSESLRRLNEELTSLKMYLSFEMIRSTDNMKPLLLMLY